MINKSTCKCIIFFHMILSWDHDKHFYLFTYAFWLHYDIGQKFIFHFVFSRKMRLTTHVIFKRVGFFFSYLHTMKNNFKILIKLRGAKLFYKFCGAFDEILDKPSLILFEHFFLSLTRTHPRHKIDTIWQRLT